MKRFNFAFTLAEVLITLGIIGVVAAITMPTLIQNHRNRVVETRLQKFYSAINQAIKMAEIDYGDRMQWYTRDNISKEAQKEWIDTYFAPYLNVVDKKYVAGYYTIYFADGSALVANNTFHLRDWHFFPGDPEKCMNKYNNRFYRYSGRCSFAFYYEPNYRKDFGPFDASWDGTENLLKYHTNYGCYNAEENGHTWKGYCGKLIQYNGWKIPKDYPAKVSY